MKTQNLHHVEYTSELHLKNNYGDEQFELQDPLTGNFYSANFDWDCSLSKRVYGQMLFLQGSISRGYADPQNRIIPSSISSARQEIALIRAICEYWERTHSDRTLHSFTRVEIQEMLRKFLLRELDDGKTIELLGPSTLKSAVVILDRSHILLHQGKLVDGISQKLNVAFKKATMAPLLDSFNIEYDEWNRGGSYGSIPMTCASIMLCEAITLMESDEAKIASIFFEKWKQYGCSPLRWLRRGTKGDRLQLYRKYERCQKVKLDRWAGKRKEATIAFGKAIDEATNYHYEELPWESIGDLAKFCEELMKAGLVIMLLLSGFRISELQGMDINDYRKEVDGSWWFKSENPKTEHGISHPRSLHGLAAEAADMLKSICAIDTNDKNIPLFHNGFRNAAFEITLEWQNYDFDTWLQRSRYGKSTLRNWFSAFYQKYVVEKHPDVVKHHKKTSPHQARHTFAEFALRRFDGNVMDKIREHFRHSYGSFHTKHYVRKKLNETVRRSLELDYLVEVMGRISQNKVEDRYFGPAARRIQIEMAQVSALTPEEFEQFIEEHANDFLRFLAFEWGYCALRKGEENLAKCIDPITGVPYVDIRSSPEVCSECPHNMNNNLQRQELKRIGIAHQYIADHHPMTVLADMSKAVVTKISARLAD